MNVKSNHPLSEILAKKLFSIESVPKEEQTKMVNRAIKAAVEFYENNCTTCKGVHKIMKEPKWNFCPECGCKL